LDGEDRVDTAEGAKEGRAPKWLVIKRMYFRDEEGGLYLYFLCYTADGMFIKRGFILRVEASGLGESAFRMNTITRPTEPSEVDLWSLVCKKF
jgi:hypothetical protein